MRPSVWTNNTRTLERDLAWHARDHGRVSQAPVLSLLCVSILVSPVIVCARMTSDMRISLLTGGNDPDFVVQRVVSLADQGVKVDFAGKDAMESAADLKRANISYLNLRGS